MLVTISAQEVSRSMPTKKKEGDRSIYEGWGCIRNGRILHRWCKEPTSSVRSLMIGETNNLTVCRALKTLPLPRLTELKLYRSSQLTELTLYLSS